MLAGILLGMLIVEGAFYAAISWGMLRLGVPWPVSAGVCLLLALGYRARLIRQMFGLSERSAMERPPEAKLDARGWRRLLLAEYASLFLLFSILFPLEPILNRRDSNPDAKGPPILLIHGYVCNGAFWWWMKGALRRAGYSRLYTMNAQPIFNGIDDFAMQAVKRIEEICSASGESQVILIGHSMGGLISRAAVQKYGAAPQVARIITLGTPHHGTYAAHSQLGLGEDSRQMRRDSPWLAELNAQACTVPITSIYTMHDNIIVPQDSSVVEDAENIALHGIGHLEIAFSKPFHRAIIDTLQGVPTESKAEPAHVG